jgi:hypothetical protein
MLGKQLVRAAILPALSCRTVVISNSVCHLEYNFLEIFFYATIARISKCILKFPKVVCFRPKLSHHRSMDRDSDLSLYCPTILVFCSDEESIGRRHT